MPYAIKKTRNTPPGYRVQKISTGQYLSSYDMTHAKAKAQLAAVILSEGKKITKLYKKTKK
jgi:hypothetical protein